MKIVLTIAGSDSIGGAGIQADLKTISAHGVFGMSVITAVTAQNSRQVIAVQDIDTNIIGKQIDAVCQDVKLDAVKIGMVSQTDSIKIIAQKLKEYRLGNIVLDPVMVSKSGYKLLNPDAMDALIKELLPQVTVVTPNIPEAENILDGKIGNVRDMQEAARTIFKLGPRNVLIKGGHLLADPTDILYDGKDFTYLEAERVDTKNTHGTGCTLSSAIASNLAVGMGIKEAARCAKKYMTTAIKHSLQIGTGAGPTNHFYELYKKAGMIN